MLDGLFAAGQPRGRGRDPSRPTVDEADAPRTSGTSSSPGFSTFLDPPKADAGEAIAALQRLGVEVKVITGDNEVVAKKVCCGHRD